jgi:hypothetical protein
VTVPTVSKKSAIMIEKTISRAARTPIRSNPPNSEKLPMRERSGVATTSSGRVGTCSAQPRGFTPSAVKVGPTFAIASMMIASTVVAMMPMSSAPRTLRTTSTPVSSTPTTNTRSGQPASWPSMPKLIGTTPSWARRMKPASTRPMIVRKKPMPTAIDVFSCGGIASNTARRKPVRTSTVMSRPSSTTRPMISGQESWVAAKTATIALMPRPVARAKG